MFLISYLRGDGFSVGEITQIIGAYMLHKGAVKLEVKRKLRYMEDEKVGKLSLKRFRKEVKK